MFDESLRRALASARADASRGASRASMASRSHARASARGGMCGAARIDARETTPVARVLNSLQRARGAKVHTNIIAR
jgi:hypothetical protein